MSQVQSRDEEQQIITAYKSSRALVLLRDTQDIGGRFLACSYRVRISYMLELESTAPKRQAPRLNANQLDGSGVY
jgi:hypothetical protein